MISIGHLISFSNPLRDLNSSTSYVFVVAAFADVWVADKNLTPILRKKIQFCLQDHMASLVPSSLSLDNSVSSASSSSLYASVEPPRHAAENVGVFSCETKNARGYNILTLLI